LDIVAEAGLKVRQVAITLRKTLQDALIQAEVRPVIDRIHPILLINRLPQHHSPAAVALLQKIVKAAGADHGAQHLVANCGAHSPSWRTVVGTAERCEIVILVCEIARPPVSSTEFPPRKCRMRTPRSKPSRLTRMNSSAVP